MWMENYMLIQDIIFPINFPTKKPIAFPLIATLNSMLTVLDKQATSTILMIKKSPIFWLAKSSELP